MMPAMEAMTAATIYPGAILCDFSFPSMAFAGEEGVEVTVCVTIEPLSVTTCTLVTGVGVQLDALGDVVGTLEKVVGGAGLEV
jgi:hypothetical protein